MGLEQYIHITMLRTYLNSLHSPVPFEKIHVWLELIHSKVEPETKKIW